MSSLRRENAWMTRACRRAGVKGTFPAQPPEGFNCGFTCHQGSDCGSRPPKEGRQPTKPARTKSGKRELASRLRAWSGFGSDDPPDRHSLPNPFVSRIPTCWDMPSTRLSSFIAEPVRFANRRTGQCSKSQPKGGSAADGGPRLARGGFPATLNFLGQSALF